MNCKASCQHIFHEAFITCFMKYDGVKCRSAKMKFISLIFTFPMILPLRIKNDSHFLMSVNNVYMNLNNIVQVF